MTETAMSESEFENNGDSICWHVNAIRDGDMDTPTFHANQIGSHLQTMSAAYAAMVKQRDDARAALDSWKDTHRAWQRTTANLEAQLEYAKQNSAQLLKDLNLTIAERDELKKSVDELALKLAHQILARGKEARLREQAEAELTVYKTMQTEAAMCPDAL